MVKLMNQGMTFRIIRLSISLGFITFLVNLSYTQNVVSSRLAQLTPGNYTIGAVSKGLGS